MSAELLARIEALELRVQKLEVHREKARKRFAKWRVNNPKKRQDLNREYYDSFNAGAKRNRQDWAIWEVELLDDEKLTDRELCIKLQRTMRAIQTKRYKMKDAWPFRGFPSLPPSE